MTVIVITCFDRNLKIYFCALKSKETKTNTKKLTVIFELGSKRYPNPEMICSLPFSLTTKKGLSSNASLNLKTLQSSSKYKDEFL